MFKIGDTIKIINLADEPFNTNYFGKTGTITHINKDCYGEERFGGTWGGIYIYPNRDTIKLVK